MKSHSVKILLLLIGLLAAQTSQAAASTKTTGAPETAYITAMRFSPYSDKLRIAIETNIPTESYIYKRQNEINLLLKNTKISKEAESLLVINDLLIPLVRVFKSNNDLIVNFPLNYQCPHESFILDSPPRLVIDLSRTFDDTIQTSKIDNGIEYLKVIHGSQSGISRVYALKVDPKICAVMPALAGNLDPNFLETFLQILNPFTGDERISFNLSSTSSIAKKYSARAAVNGTFFGKSGMPYGILMINGELLSSPLMERTALAITEDKNVFIDNFSSNDYFELADGKRVPIRGVNVTTISEGAVLFTNRFGRNTPTRGENLDIVVRNNQVEKIKFGSSYIPIDGYVLSISGSVLEFACNKIKPKDKIEVFLNLIPLSPHILENQKPLEALKSSLKAGNKIKNLLQNAEEKDFYKIKHLIGGGPRLVKAGKIYVSKFEEGFKYDVAQTRAARTAIGITADNKLLLAVVDGRRKKKLKLRDPVESIGMTLEELSRIMTYLGAEEAMNLDGGGSSAMYLNGIVINSPCDGFERRVGNALLVL